MKAKRIQLKRTKGWRKPPGAVVVSRPTKWGNPFRWQKQGRAMAVMNYYDWLTGQMVGDYYPDRRQWVLDHLHELRGKDLCCWCKNTEACHADVLIELANREAPHA